MKKWIYKIDVKCLYNDSNEIEKITLNKEFNSFNSVINYLKQNSDKLLDQYPITSFKLYYEGTEANF